MGNERVIFSNRFDRPTLEQIEEEMKNKNYDDNENLMSAEEFLEFMKQNRRTVPNEKRIALFVDGDSNILRVIHRFVYDICEFRCKRDTQVVRILPAETSG